MNNKASKIIEDIRCNHNHSLYRELKDVNRDRLNNIALEYRFNKITYRSLFNRVNEYASSLKALGYNKGDIVPCVLSNTPEFIYLLLACSKLGLVINIMPSWMDREYLKNNILSSKSKHVFVLDSLYSSVSDVIEECKCDVVMFSIRDSLPIKDGKRCNIVEDVDKHYMSFDNLVDAYKMENKVKIINQEEFINKGKDYTYLLSNLDLSKSLNEIYDCMEEDIDILDPLTITYTSGTTNPNKPKGVVQSTMSYLTLARFKRSDISGFPEMKDLRVLSHIPPYVHAGISTSMIDPLYLGCTIVEEPIYDREYFSYSLTLNRPHMAAAGSLYWTTFFKNLESNNSFKYANYGNLFLPIVTGEKMQKGEEVYYNKMIKEKNIGINKFNLPINPTVMSIGGGTSESSGIFFTLFKALQDLNPIYKVKGVESGLTPLKCADIKVIDGMNEVRVGEVGDVYVYSPCNMIEYYNNQELTNESFINIGTKKYLKMGVDAIKTNNNGNIDILGRKEYIELSDKSKYPIYKINDIISKDTKHILSVYTLVKKDCFNNRAIVVHFEPQTSVSSSLIDSIMYSMVLRLKKELPNELFEDLYIRYHSNIESFPCAPSGKRDINELKSENVFLSKRAVDIFDYNNPTYEKSYTIK